MSSLQLPRSCVHRSDPMNTFLRGVTFGVRLLLKQRLVSAVVIVTLAFGIGATSPIVSLVSTVLLRRFPHLSDPGRLYWLFETRGEIDFDHVEVTPANFARWKEEATQFQSVAAFAGQGQNIAGPAGPERVFQGAVTANYFRTAGTKPEIGRDFEPGEDAAGHDHVVILGHAYWQRRFGANPKALGQTVSVDGTARTVVGILPPGYGFPYPADIWVPLVVDATMRANRSEATLSVVGRLKPEATEESANTELGAIAARLAVAFPDTNGGQSAKTAQIADILIGPFRAVDILLLIAAALTILVAAANVGNILLAQGTARRAEIALRAALGATRPRLVRQLLTECFLLCAAGGALGLLVSRWALDLFQATMPPSVARQVMMLTDLSIDWRCIAAAAVMTIGTTFIAGLWPAWRLAETSIVDALKEQGQQATPARGQRRLSKILVAGQVALALALSTGAVATVREVAHAEHVKLGFEPNGVLVAHIARSDEAAGTPFYRELTTRLGAIPGVKAVGLTSVLPLKRAEQLPIASCRRRAPSADGR